MKRSLKKPNNQTAKVKRGCKGENFPFFTSADHATPSKERPAVTFSHLQYAGGLLKSHRTRADSDEKSRPAKAALSSSTAPFP